MKRFCLILCFALAVVLLASCSTSKPNEITTPTETTTKEPPVDNPVNQGIKLDNTDGMIIGVGEIKKLTAISLATNSATFNVIWTSTDPSVATVDAGGNVKGIANGTAVITATTIDGKYMQSCPVSVSTTVSGIELDKSNLVMNKGESVTLVATVLPVTVQNNGVIWYSSLESVATVTSDGMVTAVSSGATTICAKTADGKFSAYCNITVRTPVTSIDITDTAVVMEKGTSLTLSYTITPIDASDKTINWSSSDTSVVTVYNGRITAVGAGTANITATASSGATSSCLVTVTAKATGVMIESGEYTLIVDSSDMLIATVLPEDANNKNVFWTSSNSNVIEVERNTGIITAVACGEATVTAITEDGSFTASCVIKVVNPVKSISFDTLTYDLIKNDTVVLTPVVVGENAVKPCYPAELVWTSSDESIAVVDSEGNVTAVGHGSAIITVTASSGVSAECTVNSTDPDMLYVPVDSITTDKDIYTVYVGDKIVIETAITPANATNKTLTYEVSSDSIISINNGVIKAEKDGTVILTIRTSNYNVYAEVLIFVETLTKEEVAIRKAAYLKAIEDENARHAEVLAQLKQAYDKQYAYYEKMLNAATDPKTQEKISGYIRSLTDKYNSDYADENTLYGQNILAIEAEYEYLKEYLVEEPEPTITSEPTETGEPPVTGEPTVTAEPTVTGEPETTGEPAVTGEITATGEPTATGTGTNTETAETGTSGSTDTSVSTGEQTVTAAP